jgi:Ni/Co efflux regulator RcnB
MKFLVKPVLLSAALLVGLPMASALADNGRDHRRHERHHDHGWRDRDRHHHHHRHDNRGWRGYDRSYYYTAPRYYRPPPVYYVRPAPYYYDPYGVQFTWNFR